MLDVESEVKRFKMDLLRKMPFYGDIVMRLPFIENTKIPTARTNGGRIDYNPEFLSSLTQGQRNFVLMHEVFHILLFHCKRNSGRNPMLWNTAADMIVNSILMNIMTDIKEASIPFERPVDGIYANVGADETVENLYEQLLADNKQMRKNSKKVMVRLNTYLRDTDPVKMDIPDDIQAGDIYDNTLPDTGLSEKMILQIIRESASANRSNIGSYYVPTQIFGLTESKFIKWDTLLRNFFTEGNSDESSYTTPERKYIHMDLIIPGYGLNDEKIEDIWAFVDSSCSIEKNDMDQFLTQLWRISKEFKCVFNICYWDTNVTDVYRNIKKKDDILKCVPLHSGGTDINCVYSWINENKVNPDVMLILTDGYFGTLDRSIFKPSLGKKTILVLSNNIPINNDMKIIGKITRLM